MPLVAAEVAWMMKVYRIRTGEEDQAAVTPVGIPEPA